MVALRTWAFGKQAGAHVLHDLNVPAKVVHVEVCQQHRLRLPAGSKARQGGRFQSW